MPIPLKTAPAYIILSHQWIKHDPQSAQFFWQAVVKVRQSPEYHLAKAAIGYVDGD